MSCLYNYPYNQTNQGNMDMNKAQNGGYMSNIQNRMQQMNQTPMQMQQTPMQMQQMNQMPMQGGMRIMQTAAPTGTTPLIRSLPTAPSIAPPLPLTSLAGTVPTVTSGITPLAGSMPATTLGPETPVTVASPYYTAGFLKNFIGKNVRVEFLMGTAGSISDRVGTLLEVGASYIVIQPLLTDDLLMCDLYSIRFVTIFG